MRKALQGVFAAALITASTVAATAPAQADRGSGAIVAGIAGLAIGAAIASDHRRDYYSEPVGYYAPSPSAYYDGGYGYTQSYGYGHPYRSEYREYERRDGYGWDRGRHYGNDYRRGYRVRRDWDRDGRR